MKEELVEWEKKEGLIKVVSAISDICAQASLVVLFKDHSILGYEKKKPHFKYVFLNYNQDSKGGKK